MSHLSENMRSQRRHTETDEIRFINKSIKETFQTFKTTKENKIKMEGGGGESETDLRVLLPTEPSTVNPRFRSDTPPICARSF